MQTDGDDRTFGQGNSQGVQGPGARVQGGELSVPGTIPLDPRSDSPTGRSSGFRAVARKTASRTVDLLAAALVIVGGLGLGSYLTDWWSTDPEDVTSVTEAVRSAVGTEPQWGADGEPVVIGFGDHPGSLLRQALHGSYAAALDELERQCRDIVETAPVPARPVDEAERNVLEVIRERKPADGQPDGSRVDRLARPWGIVVGTKLFSPKPAPEKGGPILETQRRVVCWGWAVPAADNVWTLWTVQAWGAGVPPASLGQLEVPLPPGSRRILSLHSEGVGTLVGFEGPGLPEEWSTFFDQSFRERGWTPAQPWTRINHTWSARFGPAGESSPGRADVQFYREGPSRLTGLIHVTTTRGRP